VSQVRAHTLLCDRCERLQSHSVAAAAAPALSGRRLYSLSSVCADGAGGGSWDGGGEGFLHACSGNRTGFFGFFATDRVDSALHKEMIERIGSGGRGAGGGADVAFGI
jgi:hypothetical protein